MKMPQLLILLLTILVHVAAGFPTDRRALPGQDKHASWDDVNVVAHGLLQLGQGLKEHVDKTKAQMRDINGKLKAFNSTMAETETGQQLQRSLRNPIYPGEGKTRLVAAQNRRIDQLVEKIKQQQSKLEKQSLHLQTLQSKRGQKYRMMPLQTLNSRYFFFQLDCHDLFVRGQRTSGIYTIQPENSQPFSVLCEMTSEGGWTIIQKRQDGSQNFNQLWESYKKGFGSLNGEFWLGLENIHSLSKQGQYVLQVELSDWAGEQHMAHYRFLLDGEEKLFALHLEQETSSGAEEEIMTTAASGRPFSTADRDNDLTADINCAELLTGGWWFSSCGESNLNGRYPKRQSPLRRQKSRRQAMFWTSLKGQNNSLKTTLLKIAPVTIKQ
uniref:Angiopoietin-related protein 4-like n=1 Tax=Seriola lalandi dorsalis TaxID=1841481 RepID=A0A3B4YXE6_SERLL